MGRKIQPILTTLIKIISSQKLWGFSRFHFGRIRPAGVQERSASAVDGACVLLIQR